MADFIASVPPGFPFNLNTAYAHNPFSNVPHPVSFLPALNVQDKRYCPIRFEISSHPRFRAAVAASNKASVKSEFSMNFTVSWSLGIKVKIAINRCAWFLRLLRSLRRHAGVFETTNRISVAHCSICLMTLWVSALSAGCWWRKLTNFVRRTLKLSVLVNEKYGSKHVLWTLEGWASATIRSDVATRATSSLSLLAKERMLGFLLRSKWKVRFANCS